MTLQHIAPSPCITYKQDEDVWSAFWNCCYPPVLSDFVYTVLWSKLKVQQRLLPISRAKKFPLCYTKIESITHDTIVSFSHTSMC